MKSITAKVVSQKQQKTVVVERTINYVHPAYKKIMKKHTRHAAHCEIPVQIGDIVKLISTRPLSKHKYFKVVEKLHK